jgi:putative membrane protein insertion efficiency factor
MTASTPIRILNSIGVACAILLIRSYQILLSPFLIGGCRHLPTCSDYAIEAFTRHGAWRGLRLTAARLWRCRPGGTYGHDPVPSAIGKPAEIER